MPSYCRQRPGYINKRFCIMKKRFAAVPDKPNTAIDRRISEMYPVCFKHTDTFHLVSADPPVVSQDIAEVVGIKGDDRVGGSSGDMFKMHSAYSGYTQQPLWKWLSSVTKEG